MPIFIDTNNDNIDEQVEQINKRIALNKQVDAKYFSKAMTGNGKRKNGLFALDGDTFNDFMQEKRRLIDKIYLNESRDKTIERHQNHTFGNFFHQSTKATEDHFKKFENNLTSMIPPIILEQILAHSPVALSFPKRTAMYSLGVLETNWTEVTKGTIDGQAATTFALPVIQSMRMYSREKTYKSAQSGSDKTESQVTAQPEIYVLFATVIDNMDQANSDMIFTSNALQHNRTIDINQGIVTMHYLREQSSTTYDYSRLCQNLDSHLDRIIGNKDVKMPGVTPHQLSLVIGDQSISEILKSQATLMTHQAEEALLTFAKTYTSRMGDFRKKNITSVEEDFESGLITFVQHIDTLNIIEDDLITTNLLASIYETFKENVGDQNKINKIARHSLRLLLSQRLHELDDIRNNGGLYNFDPQNENVKNVMTSSPDYSIQQKKIVGTIDPLVIGQAGAGSGKSHTLVGRINYLEAQGEELDKVLVLSFTNVSALNIKNRFPGVRSITLANMFHTIYTATYPAQKLSQPSTVANSIRLLNPSSNYFVKLGLKADDVATFINAFAARLEQFDQTGFKRVDLQQELKRMSNLIENNLNIVAHVLNAVEQTTLEIEPIIIHHSLLTGNDNLIIPDEYQNLNYIITDESQDISTFEYILLLELTIHYRSQLLIIGDGSQTLYEFRNSDPRYMNALESSNIFTSHKLETNYRSNEEILMYANQFLQVIEANKYANIQLKSATFTTPTEQSVAEAITIADNPTAGNSNQYVESLAEFINEDPDFEEWFIDRVKKGEQIAFMGWTRKEVIRVGEILVEVLNRHNLGSTEITNIMSTNERPMTILSRFAHKKNLEIRGLDPTNAQYLSDMERHIKTFIKQEFTKSSPSQSSFYNDFILRNIKAVIATHEWNAWLTDYRNGRVNSYQIGSFMLQQLLRLETRKNAMDQFLNKDKDIPNYDDCPILLSTIHGTKGLEFDHTVVLYNERKRGATSQESMRMMFVALSRAKKSQFIVNSHAITPNRAVSDTQAAMFQTPMNSAYLRTMRDVRELTILNATP